MQPKEPPAGFRARGGMCCSAPPLPRNEAPGVVRTSGAFSFGLTERTAQVSEKI